MKTRTTSGESHPRTTLLNEVGDDELAPMPGGSMTHSSPIHRVSLASAVTVALTLLLIVGAIPAAQAQTATPVASPVPAEADETLPPAWLAFGPNGRLIARVIVAADCPFILFDGFATAMMPRTPPARTSRSSPARRQFPSVSKKRPLPVNRCLSRTAPTHASPSSATRVVASMPGKVAAHIRPAMIRQPGHSLRSPPRLRRGNPT